MLRKGVICVHTAYNTPYHTSAVRDKKDRSNMVPPTASAVVVWYHTIYHLRYLMHVSDAGMCGKDDNPTGLLLLLCCT